tara:strand:+ start:56011 stop:58212 length:2202 start_codon:yes stop_codon:yes gene_type:complete
MFDIPGPLGTFFNFLTIAIGFGSIIFIHELGHFVAAKWAGIRVLAFSIGFGNVLCSYRKGIGFRKGSSDGEYLKLLNAKAAGATTIEGQSSTPSAISPTEYRLSMLPLGGYVKMLGQEDLNPEATSGEADSYQNCSVPKRMVVICAGVVMNLIMAAVLFVIVFMVGLNSFPAKVGYVGEDSPAAKAIAIDRPEIATGLVREDRILSVNGNTIYSYDDLLPEIAMAPQNRPTQLLIERAGYDEPIVFETTLVKSGELGLFDLGIDPSMSTTIPAYTGAKQLAQWKRESKGYGLDGFEPGDRIVSANGQAVHSPFDVLDLAKATQNAPITLLVERQGESAPESFEHTISPVPAIQMGTIKVDGKIARTQHLLGLMGVMMVNPNAEQAHTKQGLMPGDLFAKIASTEYPTISQGIATIQEHRGKPMDIVVLRTDEDGALQRIRLTVEVKADGTVGFYPANSAGYTNIVAAPTPIEQTLESADADADGEVESEFVDTPASKLIEYPGSRIAAVGDHLVANLRDVHLGILRATNDGYEAGDESFDIPVTIQLPLPVQPDGSIPTTTTSWTLTRADVESVRDLGWTLPGGNGFASVFQVEQFVDKADGPLSAISRGLVKSRTTMLQTYLTFLRLFQGSVKVEHLKGPVGIAHLGTMIASQGWVRVLFFMAMISINLAVINFLPLPIVDGGQFLMLLYEGIRGKPVSIVFQNVTTLAGLALIGTIFIFVTFNDVKALFGI